MMSSAIRINYTMPYLEISANTNANPNQRYAVNDVGVVTVTLPAAQDSGTIVAVTNLSGGFEIVTTGASYIRVDTSTSTPGPSGSVNSNNDGNSVTLEYNSTLDEWTAICYVGTLTVA